MEQVHERCGGSADETRARNGKDCTSDYLVVSSAGAMIMIVNCGTPTQVRALNHLNPHIAKYA